MPRYVMSSRRAGKFTTTEKQDAIRTYMEFTDQAVRPMDSVTMLSEPSSTSELGRRISVFEASTEQMVEMASKLPDDVIMEPELFYQPTGVFPPDLRAQADFAPADGTSVFGNDASIRFRVRGGGGPLEHAEVALTLQSGPLEDRVTGITDGNGEVTLFFSSAFTPTVAVAVPYHEFWTTVAFSPSGTQTITCPKLPTDGPRGWWHRVVGAPRVFNPDLGEGIRVGVIDTGCGPNGNLSHVTDAGAAIGGGVDPTPGAGADVGKHGSHVCGTIGARPQEDGEYGGIAPGCDLTSMRVFPTPDGASNADIANAIDVLSMDHQADIINMSLGGEVTSLVVGDALTDAVERGTLCIAAAANSSGPVEFPANHPDCVAVSAIGLVGEAPANTLSSLRVPSNPSEIGFENLFMATFSCRGPEIELAGPGVAVIATVPERHGLSRPYAVMDGTSMASPAVSGAVAAILSRNPTYAGLPRNAARSQFARSLAQQFARDIGLSANLQGRGMPNMAGVVPNRNVTLTS